ncbi:MAG: hypothetical protein NTV22_00940, partial [bacterium]|nr:hypothetical protein [bacterium]
MSVAEVKALANGTYTELGPITFSKMKVSGSAVKYAAQDGTGGVLLYGPGILTIVTNGNFVAGDSVTIYGRKTVYSGLFEFDSISNLVAYHGFAGVPAATNIGVADLQMASTASTNLQNMLCVITNVSFNEAGGVFVPNMMHLVTDGILTGNTYIASGDPLQNTLIPSGPCAITGNYGYYTSGPQLLPDSIISAAPMQDPRVSVELNNINYGVVYPGQWRSLSFNVRNNGAHSNLTITAVAPVSGETSAFVVTTGFPITLPPGSNIYLSICYYGGAHGSTHSAVFALHSNDASNGVQNITVNGVVADYPLSLVRINELNSGVPAPYAEEFLEICGPAGTDITGWKLQFYFKNANGTVSNYANHTITNFVFTDEFDGMGYYAMVCSDYLPMPPWADDIANFDRFRYASGVYVASIRLLDTNNHQVHFFEYESDSCSDYGFAWPDDITYLYDPSTPNKSLSMIGLGMERTYLYWDVQDQTPGAANTLVQYSPFVNITNAPATVSYDTTFHTISGTNNDNVV